MTVHARGALLGATIAALGVGSGCAAAGEERAAGPLGSVQASEQALSTDHFEATHRNALPDRSGCDGRALEAGGIDRELWGLEPSEDGTYPVLLYFVGWTGAHTFHTAITVVEQAAQKGFVAATVGYSNGATEGIPDCASSAIKAQCAFDEGWEHSAINALCARRKADCNKGIVVIGHSLGGGVAVLARNYNERVRAVVSIGTSPEIGSPPGACFDAAPTQPPAAPYTRKLLATQHLAIVGRMDVFLEASTEMNKMTGLNCSLTDTFCSVDGGAMPTAGWYQVQHTEVTDGFAGHCHMLDGNLYSWFLVGGQYYYLPYSDYCLSGTLDPVWETSTTAPWSLPSMLNWLDQFVDH